MSERFDILEQVKGAEAIGIKREHAKYYAHEFAKLYAYSSATKTDLLRPKEFLQQEISIVRRDLMMVDLSLKREINGVESSLRQEMINLEYRLIIKLGAMMFLMTGLIVSLLGFILKH